MSKAQGEVPVRDPSRPFLIDATEAARLPAGWETHAVSRRLAVAYNPTRHDILLTHTRLDATNREAVREVGYEPMVEIGLPVQVWVRDRPLLAQLQPQPGNRPLTHRGLRPA